MTVYFIGAGPGAPDLITVRGQRLIARCPVCLYAGSLVPAEIVASTPPGATVLDTAAMTLDQIIGYMVDADEKGVDFARVHSGDPSIYGAIGEQMRHLVARDIAYEVVPGVPAFAAAAAALGRELTLPNVCQTIILTRTAVRASDMPPGEELATLAQSRATLAIHLSINNLVPVVRELTPHYGPDCPAIVAYRVSWPDQQIVQGTLADIRDKVKPLGITRTALILVGQALAADLDAADEFANSRLYDPSHHHVLRPRRAE